MKTEALSYVIRNGILSSCSLGTLFMIQREANSEFIECKQIVDANSNTTYADSFLVRIWFDYEPVNNMD